MKNKEKNFPDRIQKNVGLIFRLTKLFVGHNFRHFLKISSLLSDIFLSDKVYRKRSTVESLSKRI